MQAADDFAAVYDYLRMTYYNSGTGAWDHVSLKALATTAYTSATEKVTITATSTEAGGAASGEVTFNKLVLLQAIQALLRAECPDQMPPADPTGAIANFGLRPVSF